MIYTLLALVTGLLRNADSLWAAETPRAPRIGVLISRTGPMSDIGLAGERAIQLAREDFKEALNPRDTPAPQFIFEDSRSDPDSAATAINKLIHSDQVDVVLGDLTSTATLAAAPVAQRARIPLLTPSSTSDKITGIGNYVFAGCYRDRFQGLAMANYARSNLQAKTAVLLVDQDLDHSRDVSEVFKREFVAKGGKVLKSVTFNGSRDSVFFSQLTEIIAAKPDVVYAPVYYAKMGVIFKQAKTLQLKTQFLGTDAWDSPELFSLAEGSEVGALLTDPFSYRNPEPAVQQFREHYKNLFKTEPSSYAALTYDAVAILAATLQRLRTRTLTTSMADQIRDDLSNTKEFKGVTGMITFGPDRSVAKPNVVILKLTGSGYDYHATYYPPSTPSGPSEK